MCTRVSANVLLAEWRTLCKANACVIPDSTLLFQDIPQSFGCNFISLFTFKLIKHQYFKYIHWTLILIMFIRRLTGREKMPFSKKALDYLIKYKKIFSVQCHAHARTWRLYNLFFSARLHVCSSISIELAYLVVYMEEMCTCHIMENTSILLVWHVCFRPLDEW